MSTSNSLSLLSWPLIVAIVQVATTATGAIEHSPQQENYYQSSLSSSGANTTDLYDKVSSLLDSYPVERVNLHCARTPANLQALCGASLGWAPQMRLPNLLGHRTVEQLDSVTFLSPEPEALNYLIHKLAKDDVECKSLDQLKLLVCATVAPHCLDVLVPPCRQLCLRAKQGCRPALQRMGIEWPRFLDCRQFPSIPHDVCIGRQPRLVDNNFVQGGGGNRDQTTYVTPTVSSNMSTIISTTMISTTANRNEQSTGPTTTTTSKRRRKDKKQKRRKTTTTPGPTLETTAEPIAKDSDPTTTSVVGVLAEPPTATNNKILSNLKPPTQQAGSDSTIDVTPAATTMTVPVNTNTSQLAATTSQDVTPTSDNTTMAIAVPVETKTTSLSATTTLAPITSSTTDVAALQISESLTTVAPMASTTVASEETAPLANHSAHDAVINQENLGRTLCSTSPEWLIKAKLTDNQLFNAIRRRKIKVRSYRHIFGSFPNNTQQQQQQQQQKRRARSSSSGNTASFNSSVLPATTSFDLSSSAWLILPGLSNQLIGDPQSYEPSVAKSPGFGGRNIVNSHTYLMFGTTKRAGDSSLAPARTVTHIVGWPSAEALKGAGPVKEDSRSIVKVYREFKLRGASACAQYHQQGDSSSQQNQAANGGANKDNSMSHSLKSSADSWLQVATTVTHPAVMADDTTMTSGGGGGNASSPATARPVAARTRKHQQQPAHHRKQAKSPQPAAAAAVSQ